MEPYTIDLTSQCENSIKLLPQFDTYRTAYKHVNDQPIHAFFLIPKQLPSGPRPLFVRFHGGAWTEGEAESFMRPFFLELALAHNAIILTPDYRLRPEHQIADGLADIRSFWAWLEDGSAQHTLTSTVPARAIDLDARNLLVGGESGGGYLTAQTVLLNLTSLPIRALFVQYPALDLGRFMTERPMPPGTPRIPYKVVEDHLATLKPGQICTRATFGSRMHLFAAMVYAGTLCDLTGEEAYVDPTVSLEMAAKEGRKIPPMLLYHSKGDESIPYVHTEEWAERFKELYPDVPLHLVFLPTGDHVFDNNHTMATPWLKEPLEFVHKYWPAK